MRLLRLTLEGFKSFRDRTEVAFGDLTLLAGANNAGKSSVMQPLLLMKQTLEARYDPGPLLLHGSAYTPSSAEALFWSAQGQRAPQIRLGVEIKVGGHMPEQLGYEVALALNPDAVPPLAIVEGMWRLGTSAWTARPEAANGGVQTERFFVYSTDRAEAQQRVRGALEGLLASRTLHLPAARSLSAATHPLASVQGDAFRGRFVDYVPSVIYAWQTLQPSTLLRLGQDLQELELGGGVAALGIGDPFVGAVALQVSRLSTARSADWVNLVEVGSGVAHALPMLVALLVAGSGWLVYIEEPEAHLHPRAIRALPRLFLDAIRRGAQVVVETHSELLLLSTQAWVAEGAFANYTVRLNWLWRDDEGVSRCRGEDLDERGAFGDLPIDLDKVSLQILERYLNATIR